MRARLSRWRQDPAVRLGFAGGIVVSAAAVVGYVIVPSITGRSHNPLYAVVDSAMLFAEIPAWYHATVLLVPTIVVTVLVFRHARGKGFDGWKSDSKLLTGILIGPVTVLWALMIIFAISLGFAPAFMYPEAGHPIIYAGSVALYLLVGSFVATIATVVIVIAVGTGIGGGYAVVRAVEWLSQRFGPKLGR